jgi:ribosomal protein L16 Arg81 hydroxylase
MDHSGILARLISPLEVDEFFRTRWQKDFLYIGREARDHYNDLLHPDELDTYFQAGNLSPHFLRVVKDGRDCELDDWTVVEQRRLTDPYRVVLVEKLFRLYGDGASILINAAQRAIPSLAAFCSALEHELQTRIQANVYVTPPRAQAFAPHYDPHDVFILQIKGAKRWHLYDNAGELPVSAEPLPTLFFEENEPKQIVDLNEGELLYLPRGVVHFASTGDTSSIHVTISLMSRYWFHLLEELAEIAKNDPHFRRAIPHGLSSEHDKAMFAAEFTQRLTDLIGTVQVPALLSRSRARFVTDQSIETRGRFSDLLAIEELTLDSVLSRRVGIHYLLEEDDKNLVIVFGRERLSLPRFLKASLETLLGESTFTAREIKGPLSGPGKLELARKFVQAGFLRIDMV